MRADAADEFLIEPGLTYLNHASYGAMTRRVARFGNELAVQIEGDPLERLGAANLAARFRAVSDQLGARLGLPSDRTTLTSNATSGAAALSTSLPLSSDDVVVVFDTEYSSMIRGWQVRCEQVGARLVDVPVTLPFTGPERLLADLNRAVDGTVTYVLVSHVSSSTAVTFPLDDIATWTAERGGRLLVDAAHTPGHLATMPVPGGVVAGVFANIHKWFPTMRSVGLLSLAEDLVDVVHPAEVSLTWDAVDLTERFSWPGTFDPTPRLTVPEASGQLDEWTDAGRIDEAVALADEASARLVEAGLYPTTSADHAPPRLRAFYVDGVSVASLRATLNTAGIRAWTGTDAADRTILRISTHVYNDDADLDLLVSTVAKVAIA